MVIRCWKQEDVTLFREAVEASSAELAEFTPWVLPDPSNPLSLDERLAGFIEKFAAGEMFAYGLFDREETRVLGGAGLFARVGPDALEIGYWTRSEMTGVGYATETARALTDAAFNACCVSRTEIRCETRNVASAAVPRRLGYVLRETIQEESRIPGNPPVDLIVFEMHAESYKGAAP